MPGGVESSYLHGYGAVWAPCITHRVPWYLLDSDPLLLLPTTPQACWDPNGQRCLFVPTCNRCSDSAHVVIQRTEPAHSAVDARRPLCRSYVRRHTYHHFTRICGARGCTCGLY